jgi:hypothetical protein
MCLLGYIGFRLFPWQRVMPQATVLFVILKIVFLADTWHKKNILLLWEFNCQNRNYKAEIRKQESRLPNGRRPFIFA